MQLIHVTDSLRQPWRYAYARLPFELETAAGGTLMLAARRDAIVWVNGCYVGRTYVASHDDELRYETFDLAPHLRAGANVIALLLHCWGPPREDIPGVPAPGPIVFAARGNAGPVSLDDPARWRLWPAEEYQPARRHNSLLGHEEHRDMRREAVGWREPEFDDASWMAPRVEETALKWLPSPLRKLREELVFPHRIVAQGDYHEGVCVEAVPPREDSRWWRVRFRAEGGPLRFYHMHRAASRFLVDGRVRGIPFEPPMPWAALPHCTAFEPDAREHAVMGYHPPCGSALVLGWNRRPPGGDAIEWAGMAEGPWEPGAAAPSEDWRPLFDWIAPRALCRLEPLGVTDLDVTNSETAVIFELPRSMTVLPRIEFAEATAGVRVEVVYSERLSEREGLTIPAAYKDRIILRDGDQVYETSFQYKSARILILIVRALGGHVRLRRVAAVYRHYDYDPTGFFHSGDERLDRAWAICRNTMEFGSQDFIMDGPWREQLLYIGDNMVHNPACYHLFGNHEIVEWQHTLYAGGQMPDGLFAPNQPCRTPPDQYRLLDQVILWPIQLDMHLLYTGRTEAVAGWADPMLRLLDGFVEQFGDAPHDDPRLRNVTGWNWVDHPGLDGTVMRSIRHDGIPTAINLLHVLALDAGARLLRRLNRAADASRLETRAALLRKILRAEHWDASRGVFADCLVDARPSPEVSLHVNLLAIEAGMADDPAALLDRTWNRPGVLQMCGPFFRYHLFEVLDRLGRHEDILREIRTLWGGYVDAGLTSTPEYVPLNGEWGASVGHPWGASPAIYLIRSICGLRPLEPGWRTTRLEPHLCDLTDVRLSVPTPHGPIDAHLYRRGGRLAGRLTHPASVRVETRAGSGCDNVRLVPCDEDKA